MDEPGLSAPRRPRRGGGGRRRTARLAHLLRDLFAGHHSAGHPVEASLETNRRGIRAVVVSLAALALTAAAQLAVAVATGSVALLTDTVHNFADAATAVPVWMAFTVGRRGANRRYTYGYGRAEDLAGLVVVVAIAGSAVAAGWETVEHLLDPRLPRHLWAVALAGLVGAVGNELVARYRMRVGREIGSAALVADGHHARTDALTSLAVTAGALGVALGLPAADPVAGLVITLVIVRILVGAGRDVLRRLLDAVEPDLVTHVEETAAAVEGVAKVGTVRIRWIGHRLHGELEVLVDADLSVAEGHRIAEATRHALLHEVPRLASALVHADPQPTAGHDPHQAVSHHPDPFAAPQDRHGGPAGRREGHG